MKPTFHTAAVMLAAAMFAQIAAADTPEPVTLKPITHAQATLTVFGPGGDSKTYTPAELEEMGTYRLTTTTPWRAQSATFDGVMLTDVLASSGLQGAGGILIRAENEFEMVFSQEILESVPLMVATRVDDAPHTRRDRGPLQIVMPMDVYESFEGAREGHWVWMASAIEPVD